MEADVIKSLLWLQARLSAYNTRTGAVKTVHASQKLSRSCPKNTSLFPSTVPSGLCGIPAQEPQNQRYPWSDSKGIAPRRWSSFQLPTQHFRGGAPSLYGPNLTWSLRWGFNQWLILAVIGGDLPSQGEKQRWKGDSAENCKTPTNFSCLHRPSMKRMYLSWWSCLVMSFFFSWWAEDSRLQIRPKMIR